MPTTTGRRFPICRSGGFPLRSRKGIAPRLARTKTPGLADLFTRIGCGPQSFEEECSVLAPTAIVEIATFVSVLQLLYRLEAFYPD
jgi:hypothetical protein